MSESKSTGKSTGLSEMTPEMREKYENAKAAKRERELNQNGTAKNVNKDTGVALDRKERTDGDSKDFWIEGATRVKARTAREMTPEKLLGSEKAKVAKKDKEIRDARKAEMVAAEGDKARLTKSGTNGESIAVGDMMPETQEKYEEVPNEAKERAVSQPDIAIGRKGGRGEEGNARSAESESGVPEEMTPEMREKYDKAKAVMRDKGRLAASINKGVQPKGMSCPEMPDDARNKSRRTPESGPSSTTSHGRNLNELTPEMRERYKKEKELKRENIMRAAAGPAKEHNDELVETLPAESAKRAEGSGSRAVDIREQSSPKEITPEMRPKYEKANSARRNKELLQARKTEGDEVRVGEQAEKFPSTGPMTPFHPGQKEGQMASEIQDKLEKVKAVEQEIDTGGEVLETEVVRSEHEQDFEGKSARSQGKKSASLDRSSSEITPEMREQYEKLKAWRLDRQGAKAQQLAASVSEDVPRKNSAEILAAAKGNPPAGESQDSRSKRGNQAGVPETKLVREDLPSAKEEGHQESRQASQAQRALAPEKDESSEKAMLPIDIAHVQRQDLPKSLRSVAKLGRTRGVRHDDSDLTEGVRSFKQVSTADSSHATASNAEKRLRGKETMSPELREKYERLKAIQKEKERMQYNAVQGQGSYSKEEVEELTGPTTFNALALGTHRGMGTNVTKEDAIPKPETEDVVSKQGNTTGKGVMSMTPDRRMKNEKPRELKGAEAHATTEASGEARKPEKGASPPLTPASHSGKGKTTLTMFEDHEKAGAIRRPEAMSKEGVIRSEMDPEMRQKYEQAEVAGGRAQQEGESQRKAAELTPKIREKLERGKAERQRREAQATKPSRKIRLEDLTPEMVEQMQKAREERRLVRDRAAKEALGQGSSGLSLREKEDLGGDLRR
jgi:hypothetical protein